MFDGIESIKKQDVVYISGPMTGREDFNRPAFNAMEKALADRTGCRILNPARQPEGLKYGEYMRLAFADLIEATAVVFLPEWMHSQGAQAEYVGAVSMEIPRFYYQPQTVFVEAANV